MDRRTNDGSWSQRESKRGEGIRSSVTPPMRGAVSTVYEKRPIRRGDRIYVRIVNMQQCWRQIAEFALDNVCDLTDVYGELRHRTRGERGLTRLYIRNATRGWSFEQPFMLYADKRRVPVGSAAPADTRRDAAWYYH